MKKQVILDKDFIDDLFITINRDDEIQNDFYCFLKDIRDYELIMNYPSQEDFEKAMKENPMLRLLVETKVPKLIFNSKLANDVTKDEFYNELEPFKIFLMNSLEYLYLMQNYIGKFSLYL